MVVGILADLTVLLHFAFILFVVAGALLVLRWPRAAWVHLPAAAWGASIEFFGWMCPLTPLENALRRAGGAEGYPGGFIERYLLPIIYPGELTRELQLVLGSGVILINVGLYAVAWRRHRASV